MSANKADILSRGMEILSKEMGSDEAEQFIFRMKTEKFDYTKWQRDYFDRKTREEMDSEMDAYFVEHPDREKNTTII